MSIKLEDNFSTIEKKARKVIHEEQEEEEIHINMDTEEYVESEDGFNSAAR